jgi:ankyrin repeat protein
MHLTILAIILFGLPSLTFIWPKFNLKEKPVHVVVMTPQEADKLSKKGSSQEAGERKNKAKAKVGIKVSSEDTEKQATKVGEVQDGAKQSDKSDATASPRPDQPEKKMEGGLSVVREADPKSETQDKVTLTKNPTETPQKAVPVAGSANDTSKNLTRPNTTQEQVKFASNQTSRSPSQAPTPRPTQFSLVVRPSSPAPTQSTKEKNAQQALPNIRANEIRPSPTPSISQSRKDDLPLKSAPQERLISAAERQASKTPSKGLNASIPDAPGGKTAIAQSVPATPQTSQQIAISSVIKEMIEKLPRLKTLREELMRQGSAAKVSPAMKTSINRIEQRSQEGYAHAQFSLAEMYLTGEGVAKDVDKAIKFLNSAAIGGYLPAQLALSMLSAEGSSIKPNLPETHTWLAVAAEQGNKAAQKALPKIEKLMAARDILEARKRSYQLRKVLVLIHGTDIKKSSKSDLSERLRIAAALGDVESVHILLAQGGDADGPDIYGRTAVIESAWRGYTRIVKSLIDNGANLSAADNTKKNALMWAAINGHAEVIKDLITAGSPIDAQDSEGLTALMRAAWNGHALAVKVLVEAKANFRLKDKNNLTALDYAYRAVNQAV